MNGSGMPTNLVIALTVIFVCIIGSVTYLGGNGDLTATVVGMFSPILVALTAYITAHITGNQVNTAVKNGADNARADALKMAASNLTSGDMNPTVRDALASALNTPAPPTTTTTVTQQTGGN